MTYKKYYILFRHVKTSSLKFAEQSYYHNLPFLNFYILSELSPFLKRLYYFILGLHVALLRVQQDCSRTQKSFVPVMEYRSGMNGTSQWLALGDNLIYDQSNLRPEEVIK
jgi:hypothetical protein